MFALCSLALMLSPTIPAPRAVEPVVAFKLKYVAVEAFAEHIVPLLPPGKRVTTDETFNTVFVFAKEEEVREARALFARLDVPVVGCAVRLRNAQPKYVAGVLDALLWLDAQTGAERCGFVYGDEKNRIVIIRATPEKLGALVALAEFFDSLAKQ